MKLPARQRIQILLIGFFTIGILFVLASGLGSLEFSPGIPFSMLAEDAANDAPLRYRPPQLALVFALVVAALIVAITGLFFMAKPRQRKFILVLGLLAILMFLVLCASTYQDTNEVVPTEQVAPAENAPADEAELDLPQDEIVPQVFERPSISPWVSFTFSLVLVLALFLLVLMIFRARAEGQGRLIAFAEIAEQAVDEIQSGKDWGDAIVNCYAGMLQAVSESHHVNFLESSLTPAEFVTVMVKARMPAAPAERLTVLFERVRYGGKKATQTEIDDAVACLNELISACRGSS